MKLIPERIKLLAKNILDTELFTMISFRQGNFEDLDQPEIEKKYDPENYMVEAGDDKKVNLKEYLISMKEEKQHNPSNEVLQSISLEEIIFTSEFLENITTQSILTEFNDQNSAVLTKTFRFMQQLLINDRNSHTAAIEAGDEKNEISGRKLNHTESYDIGALAIKEIIEKKLPEISVALVTTPSGPKGGKRKF